MKRSRSRIKKNCVMIINNGIRRKCSGSDRSHGSSLSAAAAATVAAAAAAVAAEHDMFGLLFSN